MNTGRADKPRKPPKSAPGGPPPPSAPTEKGPDTHAREWSRLDAGVPLALLPVRLETRFEAGALLIRIEPDVLHHDMHIRVLRADERTLAERFWAEVGAAKNWQAASGAWRTLAHALGPWRAGWVARAVKSGAPDGKERGRPALARLLPARWVAMAWFGGLSGVLGWSQKVRAPLHLGFDIDDPHWLDEAARKADEQAGQLAVDPQARWMLDFEEAEAAGMAIRVVLSDHPKLEAHLDARLPVDELLVVGVDHDSNAVASGERLASLLDAHRYTRGLELVCQGAATNNTEEVRTGVSLARADLDGHLQRELGQWLPASPGGAPPEAPGRRSMSGRLAGALGLDPGGLVRRLEHAAVRQDEGSALMNRLLWSLSFGELFDVLLAGVDDPARNRLVDRAALGPLQEWYCANVRGGGTVATLRVGAQPFGVLPVRRLRRRSAGQPAPDTLTGHIGDAVSYLRETWREVLPRVVTMNPAGGAGTPGEAHETLLKILASHPHPWEFAVQRVTDCREVLVAEYRGYNTAMALHLPVLAALMPGWRFGESGHGVVDFIDKLYGGLDASGQAALDYTGGMLACWARLLGTAASPGADALPGLLASPTSGPKRLLSAHFPSAWVDHWNLDAVIWQAALAGKPLPAAPRSVHDLIAYIDWLNGNSDWFVELLKPEGVWAAYYVGLYQKNLALEAQGIKPAASGSGPGAELLHCQTLLARIGEKNDESVRTVLGRARDALVLHRARIAPLEPLYAHGGRSDRLLSHIDKDGPTGAFLAFEDEEVGSLPRTAPMVQRPGAEAGDRASTYLAELARADGAPAGRWDAARIARFAEAARSAAKPAGLTSYRAAGMSADRLPPLLFQLARAALAHADAARQAPIQKQLAALAEFDADELELRLRETLGLGTHRLDAWATGLASFALFAQRERRPAGLQLGAYGWVENLRRDERRRQSQGHVLAPSMAHAATAAVLRAGWTASGQDGQPHPGLAVDLSSERVRRARWLLDGLRQGQPLGELLGCRFERALHEHELDTWIEKVRRHLAAPTGDGDGGRDGDERRPVDGLDLWNRWNGGDADLQAMARSEPALARQFAATGDDLDAMLDLTSAESVYQLVQGNMPRMAASLDALGLPDVDPPAYAFPMTPRPGRTVTHRLVLSLPDPSPIAPGEGWADSPRSVAAPALERWARLALGPASRYRLVTRWVDARGTAQAASPPVDAATLGLSALDTIYLVNDAADGGPRLRARLRELAAQPGGGARPWRLEVLADSRDGLAPADLTGSCLFGLARGLRQLLTDARPADARHLGRPGDNPEPGIDADVGELAARARSLAQRMKAAAQRLAALLPAIPAPRAGADPDAALEAALARRASLEVDAPALRAALLELDRYAVAANPLTGRAGPEDADFETDRRQLVRQAVKAGRALAERLVGIVDATRALDKGAALHRAGAARRIFEAALGSDFPVPASFRLAGAEGAAAEVAASFAVSGRRPGEGPGAHMHWLSQVARVQARAGQLCEVLLHRAGAGVEGELELHTAQLPHHMADRVPEPWAASAAPTADRRPRVCVLACGPRPAVLAAAGEAAPLQALIVDQWNEVIPDAQQAAAVAFHYDAPASRPPQAILLAVVPEGQTEWTFDDVIGTVRETLEWTRLRAVGPAELAQAVLDFSQYLPALLSPVPFELPQTLLQGEPGLTHRWRLEGKTTTEDLEPGIQARIADPLFMLARQWQVGEFQGEDAATPVRAQVEIEMTPLSSVRCEPGGNTSRAPLPLHQPDAIEVLAEAQDPGSSPGELGARAWSGLRFLAMLSAAGLGALGERVRRAFPLARTHAEEELTPRDRRKLADLCALAPDGGALATGLRRDPTLAGVVIATATERTRLREIATAWLSQDDATAARAAGGSGWSSSRMEYGLSVAAASGDGEITLRAAEYPGGRLDWDAFDVSPRGPHGLAAGPRKLRVHVRIPSPLRYAGMPADRYWEFEDREVNFGGIQATPGDLQRMLITGYALSYSDDWYYVPVTLPSGQLARVTSMHVIDSLGRRHGIASLAALDHVADKARPWRMFELTGDPGPASKKSPWLLLAPSLPDSLEGPPVEEVQFLRDETSNLVWALERRVEGPLGEAIDRVLAWKTARGARDAPAGGHWRYEVAPPAPPYLVPLVPERDAHAQVRLRRGRLHQGLDERGRTVTSGARGDLLNPAPAGSPLRIFEEEIPRAGVQVHRAWQLARDRSGQVWLWLGQRKRPGRPSKEPGVLFDQLERR